jgi:hypothetical protein
MLQAIEVSGSKSDSVNMAQALDNAVTEVVKAGTEDNGDEGVLG